MPPARPTVAFCPELLDTGSCTKHTGQCLFNHTTYSCEICGLLFPLEDEFKTHTQSALHQQNLAGGEFTYKKCNVCNVMVVANPFNMTQHEAGASHVQKVAELTRSDQAIPAAQPIVGPQHTLCALCNKGIKPSAWVSHLASKEHASRLQYEKYVQALQEGGKDKHGVSVLQSEVDFGLVEKSRLVSEFAFTKVFHLVVSGTPVTLTDVRMSSTVGPYARYRDQSFHPRFTRSALLEQQRKYELTLTFDPQGNSGLFSDRLELVFEQKKLRFAISRPVRAEVAVSADQKLLAPIAPYHAPAPRSDDREKIVNEGERPSEPNMAQRLRTNRLPQTRMPFEVKNLPDEGSTYERTVLARDLLPDDLSTSTYVAHWSILLFLEELHAARDMAIYDQRGVSFAGQQGRYFLLNVPGLAERRPSVLRGDSILVQFTTHASDRWSRGYVHFVRELQVGVCFHRSFTCSLQQTINVRFELNRNLFQRMHLAVTSSFPETRLLYPTAEATSHAGMSVVTGNIANMYTPYFSQVATNPHQWEAVVAIAKLRPRAVPFIVFGPPGTGKTVVIVEAIRQILERNPSARILASAPSNSAADILTTRLVSGPNGLTPRDLFRLNAPNRMQDMPENLRPYSLLSEDGFDIPAPTTLDTYKVIVTTCATAYQLWKAGAHKGFSHIFVDEAGQASEPEVMIAVRLIGGPKTNVILAGDPKQLGPIIRSPIATNLGLGVSWLDRLMRLPLYDPKLQRGITVVKLLFNFRSHEAILSFPNTRFYDGELQYHANPTISNSCLRWPGLPNKKFPVVFHAIKGQDLREASSPSFFNIHEASTVNDYVTNLLKPGLGLKPEMIGIIAPYHNQCKKIRKLLGARANDIKVGSAEQFQGDERRVIIISTVRSSSKYLEFDVRHNLGFVSNARRFNVAVTRAQALLVIVGDPDVLGMDPRWRAFLNYIHNGGGWKGRVIPWDPLEVVDEEGKPYDEARRQEAAAEMSAELARAEAAMGLDPSALVHTEEDNPEVRRMEAAEERPWREDE